jgi:uncharacterized membrane protein
MIETSKLWIERLATGVEAAAALIVALAAVEALARALPLFARRTAHHDSASLRLAFGRWLSVALEFALAADVLRTAVAPSWSEIGQLAAIAGLRTGLNFTLERDNRRAGD